jgi:hypothetical protein
MAERHVDTASRREWEEMRRNGVWPHALRRGLLRGIPMGILVIVLLEAISGRGLDGDNLASPVTLGRFALAIVLFSLSGVLSTYARWRALDLRYGAHAEP